MPVQFNSFGGGPHGGSPIVLPKEKHPLGELGDALGAVGNIPSQIQQIQLKQTLNRLLMDALTQPRNVDKYEPGKITSSPAPGEFYEYETGITVPSAGEIFSQAPGKMGKAPNPDYEETIGRLTDVGPAFGFDFNRRKGHTIEDLIRLEMAKGSGRRDLETQKQEGRKELEGVKGDVRKEVTSSLYDEKSELEGLRAKNRERLVGVTYDKKAKLQSQHDSVIERIKKDDRLSDEQKHRQTLAERTRHNKEMEAINTELLDIRRKNTSDPDAIRTIAQIERFSDEMRNLDTQFARMSQMPSNDPNTVKLLEDNVARYNNLGRQIQRMEPGYFFEDKKLEDVPWYRDPFIPGIGTPAKKLAPSSGTPPPRAAPQSLQPPKPKQEQAPSRSQFKTPDEYLNARREWLKRQNEQNR